MTSPPSPPSPPTQQPRTHPITHPFQVYMQPTSAIGAFGSEDEFAYSRLSIEACPSIWPVSQSTPFWVILDMYVDPPSATTVASVKVAGIRATAPRAMRRPFRENISENDSVLESQCFRICAFPGLGITKTTVKQPGILPVGLRLAKPPPPRVPCFLSIRPALTTWARGGAPGHVRNVAFCFARKIIPVTPGITRSALRIPVLMGPNPGRWSYGVVAVLDERYGISDHPVTTVPP